MQKLLEDCISEVSYEGKTFAYTFDLLCLGKKGNTKFIPVPPSWGIHIGIANREKGYKVRAHAHFRKGLPERLGVEALIVIKGKIMVNLHLEQGRELSIILSDNKGIIMKCYHSVEFLEDSVILEIKEGPYSGHEKDKVWL